MMTRISRIHMRQPTKQRQIPTKTDARQVVHNRITPAGLQQEYHPACLAMFQAARALNILAPRLLVHLVQLPLDRQDLALLRRPRILLREPPALQVVFQVLVKRRLLLLLQQLSVKQMQTIHQKKNAAHSK